MDPKTSPCKSYSVRHCCFIYSNILLTYSVAHAASWWMMFGSITPKLQYLAMGLVSPCCSSSGCERNWSTFALLHTKVRNRLLHKKLNKLIYVNYNLHLRLEEVSGPPMREEGDFIDQLAHLSFYDENNPVREWMEYGRFNRALVLDEDDDDGDILLLSHIVRDQINVSDLREATGMIPSNKNVGDTHLGKRKLQKGPTKGHPKRRKGKGTAKPVSRDTETDDGECEFSPPYQESKDSSSADNNNDSDGADAGGGAGGTGTGAGGAASGSGGARGVRFTGIYCTYKCTHISDYEY